MKQIKSRRLKEIMGKLGYRGDRFHILCNNEFQTKELSMGQLKRALLRVGYSNDSISEILEAVLKNGRGVKLNASVPMGERWKVSKDVNGTKVFTRHNTVLYGIDPREFAQLNVKLAKAPKAKAFKTRKRA